MCNVCVLPTYARQILKRVKSRRICVVQKWGTSSLQHNLRMLLEVIYLLLVCCSIPSLVCFSAVFKRPHTHTLHSLWYNIKEKSRTVSVVSRWPILAVHGSVLQLCWVYRFPVEVAAPSPQVKSRLVGTWVETEPHSQKPQSWGGCGCCRCLLLCAVKVRSCVCRLYPQGNTSRAFLSMR